VPDIDDEKPYTISLVWPLPIPTLTAREIWIVAPLGLLLSVVDVVWTALKIHNAID
jgi:hypothetical protein